MSESDDDECMTEEQYQIILREQAEESAKYDWDAINEQDAEFAVEVAEAEAKQRAEVLAGPEPWRVKKIPRKYWPKTCFCCGAPLKA